MCKSALQAFIAASRYVRAFDVEFLGCSGFCCESSVGNCAAAPAMQRFESYDLWS